MSYKIAIDSCGELLNEWKDDERIEAVPLTLMVGGESIIDDETFSEKGCCMPGMPEICMPVSGTLHESLRM